MVVWLIWLAISVPIGLCIWLWGFGLVRRGHGIGWFLQGWGVLLPVGPPVVTGLTWLVAGDSFPSNSDVHEPWPWVMQAAIGSIGFVVLATPIVLGIALFWVIAKPTKD